MAPPNDFEMMDEEDDEFEVDVATRIEGTRLPSELHDAYAGGVGVPSPWAIPSSSRRVFSTSPSPSDEWYPTPSLTNARPWVTHNSSSTSGPNTLLNRQGSIRRAGRTRVDFNESSQRRRWHPREASAVVSPRPEAPENVTEPREGLVWSRPLTSHGRRFFPSPLPRRHDTSSSTTGGLNLPTWTEPADRLSSDTEDSYDRVGAHPWSEPPTINHPPSPDSENVGHRYGTDARIYRIPRLRRGGVLAPESMFSRHASPVVNAESIAVSTSTAAVASTPVVVLPLPSPSIGTAEVVTPVVPPYSPPPLPPNVNEEPVAYPTPGSTEGESLA